MCLLTGGKKMCSESSSLPHDGGNKQNELSFISQNSQSDSFKLKDRSSSRALEFLPGRPRVTLA